MYIQVPIGQEDFVSLLMSTQTEDSQNPLTESGCARIFANLHQLEEAHKTDVLINAHLLNATWTQYKDLKEFKETNFKVGSKTFETYEEAEEFTTILTIDDEDIILVASREDHDEFIKTTYPEAIAEE